MTGLCDRPNLVFAHRDARPAPPLIFTDSSDSFPMLDVAVAVRRLADTLKNGAKPKCLRNRRSNL